MYLCCLYSFVFVCGADESSQGLTLGKCLELRSSPSFICLPSLTFTHHKVKGFISKTIFESNISGYIKNKEK